MRVKLASQVLSHSVAAGIYTHVSLQGLPSEAVGTAAFLERVDKIFDSCNSLTFKDPKIQRRPFSQRSPHIEIMESGVDLFQSLKVVHKATGQDKTSNFKCLKGWVITLKSIISLLHRLYNDGIVSFLITRRLNQDPLENPFGSIRQQGGNSDNPTPIQFKRAYKKLFHTNLLQVDTGNCEIDMDQPLLQLGNLQHIAAPVLTNAPRIPLKIITTEYANMDVQAKIIKDNATVYVAGFLLRKTFLKHRCSLVKLP